MRGVFALALVLVSAALLPQPAAGQQGGSAGGQEPGGYAFELGRNYPNPFDAETRVPFDLYEGALPEGRPAIVTMRIFNILRQYVASPTTLGHPAGDGTPVVDLEYTTPGHYEAYWDGRDRSGALVPSGVYILELTVNGMPQVRRMVVDG